MALPKDKPKPRVYREKRGFKTVDGKKVPIYGKPEWLLPPKPGFPRPDPGSRPQNYYPTHPKTGVRGRGEISEREARWRIENAHRKHPRDKGFWDIKEINKILQKTNFGQVRKASKWHEGPDPPRRLGGKSIPKNEPMNPSLAGKGDLALRRLFREGEESKRGPRGTKPGTKMAKDALERELERKRERLRERQNEMLDPEHQQEKVEQEQWEQRKRLNQPRNLRKSGVEFG